MATKQYALCGVFVNETSDREFVLLGSGLALGVYVNETSSAAAAFNVAWASAANSVIQSGARTA